MLVLLVHIGRLLNLVNAAIQLCLCMSVQEDMYSYVTVADEQQFKGKSTEVVDTV